MKGYSKYGILMRKVTIFKCTILLPLKYLFKKLSLYRELILGEVHTRRKRSTKDSELEQSTQHQNG